MATSGATAASPSTQLAGFIAKFDPAVASVIRASRAALRKRLPTATEVVYDNYNFFVIGYCATERPSSCIVSLVAGSNGVALSFYHGASLPDPDHLLIGDGKQNRFVRLPTADTLAEPGVESLIVTAIAQAKIALPETGRGRLVIQSISAKQRPRRKA